MFSSLSSNNNGQAHQENVIRVVLKVDPATGFAEFPQPGELKKPLLPTYIDPEEAESNEDKLGEAKDSDIGRSRKDFWMPDRLCKVCYGCEDAFTMYRRRHHCRMCGQVFCNPCSSFYIDGAMINMQGPVRACRLCHDQLQERATAEIDNKQYRPRRELSLVRSRSQSNCIEEYRGATVNPTGPEPDDINSTGEGLLRGGKLTESLSQKLYHTNNLQNRASAHLEAIVDQLVRTAPHIDNEQAPFWRSTIVHLVREVVSTVDPDVRRGDSMDIRPYVKLKIIPGGAMDECTYIDGVVFRKNVSHKKAVVHYENMKKNPRILLLSGGIEFQRTDARLSSMETLIEQEDRYMEILVEKIMSLKPDIILVGKAVARRAQELLCEQNVAVMQNVKAQLLDRISRMTGAMMLPSTDHMIQQYGEECLGTCGMFWLRLVRDDPEKVNPNRRLRVLRNPIARGSTFAYLQGCPAELGCTLVLRGADRATLSQIKRIIRFSVALAYHLRLEVAYYNDRSAQLPPEPDLQIYNDDSDDEDEHLDVDLDTSAKATVALGGRKETLLDALGLSSDPRIDKNMLRRSKRRLLSMSLDVDLKLPYSSELKGYNAPSHSSMHMMPNPAIVPVSASAPSPESQAQAQFTQQHQQQHPYLKLYEQACQSTAQEHQTLLVTSIVMGEGRVQRSRAEIMGIRFYSTRDVAVGRFLIENCFQLLSRTGTSGGSSGTGRDNTMLDNTLSYVHRTGRIDISVHKIGESVAIPGLTPQASSSTRERRERDNVDVISGGDPLFSPIYMHSYCKECDAVVTPEVAMSDETWKMSFGKFLEMTLYNRSARGRTGGCTHCVRDSHILHFSCEGYVARFNFTPIHPFALHVRGNMTFPADFHIKHTLDLLTALPTQFAELLEGFRKAISNIRNEVLDALASRADDRAMALADLAEIEAEMAAANDTFHEDVAGSIALLQSFALRRERFARAKHANRYFAVTAPPRLSGGGSSSDITAGAQSGAVSSDKPFVDSLTAVTTSGTAASQPDGPETQSIATGESTMNLNVATAVSIDAQGADAGCRVAAIDVRPEEGAQAEADADAGMDDTLNFNFDYKTLLSARYPMIHKREVFLKAAAWNMRIETIHRFLEGARAAAQQQAHSQLGGIGAVFPSFAAFQSTLFSLAEEVPKQRQLEDEEDEEREKDRFEHEGEEHEQGKSSPHEGIDGRPTKRRMKQRSDSLGMSESDACDASASECENDGDDDRDADSVSPGSSSPASQPSEMERAMVGALGKNALSSDSMDAAQFPSPPKPNSTVTRHLTATVSAAESPATDAVAAAEEGEGEGASATAVPVATAIPVPPPPPPTDTTPMTAAKKRATFASDVGTGGSASATSGPTGSSSTSTTTTSTSSSLSKALIENEKRLERERQAKQNRLSKAFARLVLGSSSAAAESKVAVPLGTFREGRLGMKTGLKGEVIPVHEEELATLVAYCLASQEYHDKLQEFLQLDNNLTFGMALGEGSYQQYSFGDAAGTTSDFDATPTTDASGVSAVTGWVAGIGGGLWGVSERKDTENDGDADGEPEQAEAQHAANEAEKTHSHNQDHFHGETQPTEEEESKRREREEHKRAAAAAIESLERDHLQVGGSEKTPSVKAEKASSAPSAKAEKTSTTKMDAEDGFVEKADENKVDNNVAPPSNEVSTGEGGTDTSTATATANGSGPTGGAGASQAQAQAPLSPSFLAKSANEKQLTSQLKSHIRHRFEHTDEKGNTLCKYVVTVYWATQFEAVRAAYFGADGSGNVEDEGDGNAISGDYNDGFIRSLSMSSRWMVQGGKSGASFSKSLDERFIVKVISRVELQMFLEFAPAFFEYMAKAFYNNIPTALCKILGVYTIGYHNKETGKKTMENVVVMENIFYQRNITRVFDLKGSSRARYVETSEKWDPVDEALIKRRAARRAGEPAKRRPDSSQVLLDDNLMELTRGRPFPLKNQAKTYFSKAVSNDTYFLSIISVVDYSILVGFDEDSHEIVVGIIDYMRQYDIVKRMERMGKSVGMLTGQAEPTIIQPSHYKKRFSAAMERYFMTVPDKWVLHEV